MGFEGSTMLREVRFVWQQRGGVSRLRLGCFRLSSRVRLLYLTITCPHLRVHPGSSLLLVRQSPQVGSCPGQLGFSAPTCAAPFP